MAPPAYIWWHVHNLVFGQAVACLIIKLVVSILILSINGYLFLK